jgi:hypothetical protein
MSITFSRSTVNAFNNECEAALKVIADKHGLELRRENARFARDGSTCTVKYTFAGLKAAPADADADVIPADFAAKAARYGLPTDCFHRIFTFRGQPFQITGFNTRNRKYPVLATRVSDGKRFKLDTWSVQHALKAA